MSTDNTLATEQLPAGRNANAGLGQPDAQPVRPRYRLMALLGAVKRMSYLLQGNVMQYKVLRSARDFAREEWPLRGSAVDVLT